MKLIACEFYRMAYLIYGYVSPLRDKYSIKTTTP